MMISNLDVIVGDPRFGRQIFGSGFIERSGSVQHRAEKQKAIRWPQVWSPGG
jgi:hypothetical protein